MILQHWPWANTPSTPSLLLDPACVSSWAHHSNATMHIKFVLFMKFKKKILISVCKALVGIKIRVKAKPSICLIGMMAALLAPQVAWGDPYYKRAISNAGGWDLTLLWNTVGPLPLWPHACKQHSKLSICAVPALASNSMQQEWFSRLEQLSAEIPTSAQCEL